MRSPQPLAIGLQHRLRSACGRSAPSLSACVLAGSALGVPSRSALRTSCAATITIRAANASRSTAPERALASATPAAGAGHREDAQQQRVGAADVAVAILRVGPDDRHRHDRQQRGRLRLVLVEAQEDHEAGHEQHAAADAQQARDDPARPPRSAIAPIIAAAARRRWPRARAANSSEIARASARAAAARCRSARRRPPAPRSGPRRARARCRTAPCAAAAKAAMKTIAASDVPVAARSS